MLTMCPLFKVIFYASVVSCCALLVLSQENDYYSDYEDYENYDDFSGSNSTENGTTLEFTKQLPNITKSTGQSVRFTCEVKVTEANFSNSKVHFTWKRQTIPIEKEDKRVTVKNKTTVTLGVPYYSSQLHIKKLNTLDTGYYECIARYNKRRIISTSILKVDGKWGSAPSDFPTYKPSLEGSQTHTFEGGFTTFFPNINRKEKQRELLTTGSILPTLSEETISKNSFVFDKNMDPITQLNSNNDNNIFYNSSQPFCQLYSGNTCKHYLAGKYVFVQPPYTQENIETKLENAVTVVSQSNEISSSCSKFAMPSLCFSAFPICVDSEQINTHQKEFINKFSVEKDLKIYKNVRNKLALQRICKEDCELLEKELCSREYAIAKRHPVIKQTLDLDECEFLPDESDKRSMYCLSLGVERTQTVNEDEMCYWDYGGLYRGIQDFSTTGQKCIKWSYQFKIPLSEYPELSGHSYCRNPGMVENQPFCFIEQNLKEVCGIPKCGNILWFYLVIAAIIIFLFVFIATVIFYCNKKRAAQKSRLQNMNVPTADKNIYGNTGPNSPMELNTLLPTRMNNIPTRSHSSSKNGFQSVPHYTYKELLFVEELGEGAFGKVYKGDLKTKTGKIVVAVKSLKENASAKTQADFQREIELISELKHPNIICLLGVVIKQEPMCMLFEFMSEGDLHEFLIANSPHENKCLSQQQFLHIALQIAQGMEYLSENHYVHRDLAARNCLVSKDLVVKISDFGLSRDMYSCDYYRVQSKSLLPVRWMPPESILYGKFTTESDVWSYGVVLWEIYSYGLQPYYGYNNQEVINMIRSRKLLPCPDCCPSYCYVLMVECWAELSVRRPNFTEIVHRLKVWQINGNSGSYLEAPKVYTNSKHGSKSSHTSDSLTVCPSFENHDSHTWEKNLRRSGNKLNESQSSLNSHSSSMGNRTQSTSLSNDHNVRNSRKSIDRKGQKCKGDNCDGSNPKHTVVNSNGDSFETKITF